MSGTAFGDFGEGYLRFSVANSIENIEKALDRIDAWTKKICRAIASVATGQAVRLPTISRSQIGIAKQVRQALFH